MAANVVAVVGAGGVLGVKLVEQALASADAPIVAFTHGKIPPVEAARSPQVTWHTLDIADSGAVAEALRRAQPAVILNAAAMTNVDACEQHRDAAYASNAVGPRHLAAAAVALGARLVQVSSDYVFPGDDAVPGPYDEGAAVRPVNHYGWTKLMGERAVQEVCAGHVPWLIVRTALVYGYVPGGRTNFVRWVEGELHAGRRVRVVHDQINTPTLADDLAAALFQFAQRAVDGMIHLAGPDLLSRADWARQIARARELDAELIDVVSSQELGQLARRPLRSGLRSRRDDALAGVTMRGVQAALNILPTAAQ